MKIEDKIRAQLVRRIVRIAQEASLVDQSKESAISTVNKGLEKLTLETEDFLTGEGLTFVEDKLAPLIKGPAEEFIKNNSDKGPQYIANPDLLIQDINDQIPIVKYLGYLSNALDAASIIASIMALATATLAIIPSGGASIPLVAAEETAKLAIRKQIKNFIKTRGKEVLTKIFSKQILKTLARASVGVGKAFLDAALWRAQVILYYDVLSSVISDVTLTALKNILLERGTTQFKIPKDIVDSLVKPETNTDAFRRILGKAKQSVESDLANLFTTEQGYKDIAYTAALTKLWKVFGINSKLVQLNMRRRLNQLLEDPSYSKLDKLKSNLSKRFQFEQNPNADVDNMLKKSKIPETLHKSYRNYIAEAIADLESSAAEEKAKTIVHSTDLMIESIYNNIKELAILDFIKENYSRLKNRKADLDRLLQDVTDSKIGSVSALMEETGAKTFEGLISDLRKRQVNLLKSQIGRVLVDNRDDKNISNLMQIFGKTVGYQNYKSQLSRDIFGEVLNVGKEKFEA